MADVDPTIAKFADQDYADRRTRYSARAERAEDSTQFFFDRGRAGDRVTERSFDGAFLDKFVQPDPIEKDILRSREVRDQPQVAPSQVIPAILQPNPISTGNPKPAGT